MKKILKTRWKIMVTKFPTGESTTFISDKKETLSDTLQTLGAILETETYGTGKPYPSFTFNILNFS